LSNDLMASVKSVLGTCQAMGLLVDSKEISEINADVTEGKYDAMVAAGKTEVDEEKKAELKDYFKNIDSKQKAASKAAEEAAAAEAESTEAAPEEEKKE